MVDRLYRPTPSRFQGESPKCFTGGPSSIEGLAPQSSQHALHAVCAGAPRRMHRTGRRAPMCSGEESPSQRAKPSLAPACLRLASDTVRSSVPPRGPHLRHTARPWVHPSAHPPAGCHADGTWDVTGKVDPRVEPARRRSRSSSPRARLKAAKIYDATINGSPTAK